MPLLEILLLFTCLELGQEGEGANQMILLPTGPDFHRGSYVLNRTQLTLKVPAQQVTHSDWVILRML